MLSAQCLSHQDPESPLMAPRLPSPTAVTLGYFRSVMERPWQPAGQSRRVWGNTGSVGEIVGVRVIEGLAEQV